MTFSTAPAMSLRLRLTLQYVVFPLMTVLPLFLYLKDLPSIIVPRNTIVVFDWTDSNARRNVDQILAQGQGRNDLVLIEIEFGFKVPSLVSII